MRTAGEAPEQQAEQRGGVLSQKTQIAKGEEELHKEEDLLQVRGLKDPLSGGNNLAEPGRSRVSCEKYVVRLCMKG